MILRTLSLVLLASLTFGTASAQEARPAFPDQILVARHTYFDFGPPFDFYEVMSLTNEGSSTKVERILVTPAGSACVQPPTVETKTVVIEMPLSQVMQSKNPCDIPERALRQERKRCKHCLTFSGVNVTFAVSCKTGDRPLRADILDKDLFDHSAKMPANTSWTMQILNQLDGSLGLGVMDKPIFSIAPAAAQIEKPSHLAILENLKNGSYDGLFTSEEKLSELYTESQAPVRTPSVEVLTITPTFPLSADAPPYPPIARAAHVEGEINLSFEISAVGKVEQVSFGSGPALLRNTVSAAVAKWQFPESAEARHENARIAFRLNCPQTKP